MEIFKFEYILDIIDKKGYETSINKDGSIRVKVKLYEGKCESILDEESIYTFIRSYQGSEIDIKGYEHIIPSDIYYAFKYESETVEKKWLFSTSKKEVGKVFLIFDIEDSTLEEVETFFKQKQPSIPMTHTYKGKFVNTLNPIKR